MPDEGYITSFSPDVAQSGELIEVELQPIAGLEDETAMIMGGMWVPADSVSAGPPVPVGGAYILDDQEYSRLSATLPDPMRDGKYTLKMNLRIGTQTFDIDSDGLTVLVQNGGVDQPHINSITPQRTTITNLPNARFTVRGALLSKVEQWSIESRPSFIRMLSVGEAGDDTQKILRSAMVPEGIQPGRYKLKMLSVSGASFSTTSITIEE